MYADDITYVVLYGGKSKQLIARKTIKAIGDISDNEKWKKKIQNINISKLD